MKATFMYSGFTKATIGQAGFSKATFVNPWFTKATIVSAGHGPDQRRSLSTLPSTASARSRSPRVGPA
jgi:hypothetical protein